MPYGRNINASTQGIALLVVALLLVQYAPLFELAGGGLDHHCVECTENYCTRYRCYCGHEHAHESTANRDHSAQVNIAAAHTGPAQTAATSTGSDTRYHDHHAQAADQAGEYGESIAGEPDTPAGHSRRVAFRPCGTDNPQGIPVLQVDHFLLTDAGDDDVQGYDRPRLRLLSSSVYPQTAGDDIFRPPAGLA